MDESWRMRIGMPSPADRRRSSEDLTSSGSMDAEYFSDVFGGPPKSVLNRKLSCNFTSSDYFYNDIFRRREEDEGERSRILGRRLPEFRIPASRAIENKAEFYSDVFGSESNSKAVDADDDDQREKKSRSTSSSSRLWRSMSISNWTWKSKSRSKSNSSSVLSCEEISAPIRSGIGENDVALESYAAKLRPINVPCRWSIPSPTGEFHEDQISENAFPFQKSCIDSYYPPNEYNDEHFTRILNRGFSNRFPSPETDIPYATTVGIPVEGDSELETPSSANSMFYRYPESSQANFPFNASHEAEEDGLVSSYVIEVNSRGRGATNEAADIDEAIAWAKEKYQGCSSSSGELNVRQHETNYQSVWRI